MQKSDSLPQFHSILSKKYWREAAKQLKSTQMLTIAALIVALRVAVKFINIKIAPGITITFDGYVCTEEEALYYFDGEESTCKTEKATVKLVPYSTFANRGETDMSVWLNK